MFVVVTAGRHSEAQRRSLSPRHSAVLQRVTQPGEALASATNHLLTVFGAESQPVELRIIAHGAYCVQDYPSISQIANKVSENNVNVIFAVKRDQVALYEKLSAFIAGSVVGELANDSSNIVDLVKLNYEVRHGCPCAKLLVHHTMDRFCQNTSSSCC